MTSLISKELDLLLTLKYGRSFIELFNKQKDINYSIWAYSRIHKCAIPELEDLFIDDDEYWKLLYFKKFK